jgi:glycosyltransferase involved in cell wall biosynthesis
MNKKIAIVHDFLVEFGGAEKVLLDILDAYPSADLYTLIYDQKKMGEYFDKFKPKTSYLQRYPKFLKGSYLRPLMPSGAENLDLSKYDLVISNCNSFAKGVLVNPETTHISYIHSPTRYLWDYYHKYLKEHKLTGLKSIVFIPMFNKLRLWDKSASRRPDHILANSKNVAKRIDKYYRRKSKIIYPGVDLDKFYQDKKGNYFLIVSRLSKYKNIQLAIEAFNELNERLLIIGSGPERKELEKIANKNIEFLGFKSNEIVRSYYSRARAFIFPQEEDFGLTPIEAMASGVPVIAYRKGGALETIKENVSGIFFNQESPEKLKEAVKKFIENESSFDRKEIAKQAEKFSSNNFIKNFAKEIERITNEQD